MKVCLNGVYREVFGDINDLSALLVQVPFGSQEKRGNENLH